MFQAERAQKERAQKEKAWKRRAREESNRQESDQLESDVYESYELESDEYEGYGVERDQLESDRLETWSDQLESDYFQSDEDESDEDESDEDESDEDESDEDESDPKKMLVPDIARWRKKINTKNSHAVDDKRQMQLNNITTGRNALEYASPNSMEVLRILLQQIACLNPEKYPECLGNTAAISSEMRGLLRPEALAVFEAGNYSLQR
jgi:hypothetical protein